MQLVEQGKLSLDDVQQVEKIAPELRDVKALEGDLKSGFKLVDKDRGITLRMLLNHTGISPPPPPLLSPLKSSLRADVHAKLASDIPSTTPNSATTPCPSATMNSPVTQTTFSVYP